METSVYLRSPKAHLNEHNAGHPFDNAGDCDACKAIAETTHGLGSTWTHIAREIIEANSSNLQKAVVCVKRLLRVAKAA